MLCYAACLDQSHIFVKKPVQSGNSVLNLTFILHLKNYNCKLKYFRVIEDTCKMTQMYRIYLRVIEDICKITQMYRIYLRVIEDICKMTQIYWIYFTVIEDIYKNVK